MSPLSPWQVYLDVDVLLSPKDFVGLAPMSILCARLSSVWNPGVDDLDYPLEEEGACAGAVSGTWSARTASDIISLFREFVAELLQVRRCLIERPLVLPGGYFPFNGYFSVRVLAGIRVT